MKHSLLIKTQTCIIIHKRCECMSWTRRVQASIGYCARVQSACAAQTQTCPRMDLTDYDNEQCNGNGTDNYNDNDDANDYACAPRRKPVRLWLAPMATSTATDASVGAFAKRPAGAAHAGTFTLPFPTVALSASQPQSFKTQGLITVTLACHRADFCPRKSVLSCYNACKSYHFAVRTRCTLLCIVSSICS